MKPVTVITNDSLTTQNRTQTHPPLDLIKHIHPLWPQTHTSTLTSNTQRSTLNFFVGVQQKQEEMAHCHQCGLCVVCMTKGVTISLLFYIFQVSGFLLRWLRSWRKGGVIQVLGTASRHWWAAGSGRYARLLRSLCRAADGLHLL